MSISSFLRQRFGSALLILLTLSLVACSHRPPSEPSPASVQSKIKLDKQDIPDETRATIYQALLTAEMAKNNKDYETALTQYLYVLSYYPDIEVAAEAIKVAQKQDDATGLIQGAEAWLTKEPKASGALQAMVLGYLKLQNTEKALVYTNRLIQLSPSEEEAFVVLSGLSRLYLAAPTVQLWELLVEQNPNSALAHTLIAYTFKRAADGSGNISYLLRVKQELDTALTLNPQYSWAIQLNYKLIKFNKQQQEATQYLEQLHQQYPDNKFIYSLLAQDYYQLKRYDDVINLANAWLDVIQEENEEAIYYLAAGYYGKKDYKRSHKHFLTLVTKQYKPEMSYYYCGYTAEQIKKYLQATLCFQQVPYGQYWLSAQKHVTYILMQQDQPQKALAELDEQIQTAPYEYAEQASMLKVELLVELEQPQQAIEWLEQNITPNLLTLRLPLKLLDLKSELYPESDLFAEVEDITPKIPTQLTKDWYLQAGDLLQTRQHTDYALQLYEHALTLFEQDVDLLFYRALARGPEQVNLMEQELRQVHNLAPQNAHIKNALGYTLADANKELDFALKLISEAYNELPESAAILDSMGWVYFRLGQFDKAEEFLRQSILRSKEPEVASHLIQILFTNKKETEAKQIFQEYWLSFPNNRHLEKVKKQFNLEAESAQ